MSELNEQEKQLASELESNIACEVDSSSYNRIITDAFEKHTEIIQCSTISQLNSLRAEVNSLRAEAQEQSNKQIVWHQKYHGLLSNMAICKDEYEAEIAQLKAGILVLNEDVRHFSAHRDSLAGELAESQRQREKE